MLENLEVRDQVVYKWLAEIKAWSVHAILPEGFKLANGIQVPSHKALRQHDYGTDFGDRSSVCLRGMQSVEDEHKGANFVEVFPYKDGQVVRYSLTIYSKDSFKRSSDDRDRVDLLFSGNLGDVLVGELDRNPELLDKLIIAKFPLLATKGFVPWKELIYLPPDLDYQNRNQKLQVLATR